MEKIEIENLKKTVGELMKSKADNEKKKLNIAILTASENNPGTQSIKNAGKKRGHNMTVYDPEHLYLLISDITQGYDRVYSSDPDKEKPERIKAKDIDAVISRVGKKLSYGCAVLEHFNRNLNIFCTQSAEGLQTASNKLISLQKISQEKIRVPKTVIGDNIVHAQWLIDQVGGLPAWAKTLQGSQGIGVFPLKDPHQTNAMLESFHKQKMNLIIQQNINSEFKDMRVIIIDRQVIVAMERTAKEGELRSNISLGGSGKKIELSAHERETCIKAAEAVGLGGACGVDLIKDVKTNKCYIIECNGNYGYKVEDYTGVDISTPLIEFCERNYKKGSIGTPTLSALSDEAFKYALFVAMGAGVKSFKKSQKDINHFLYKMQNYFLSIGMSYSEVEKDIAEFLKYYDNR